MCRLLRISRASKFNAWRSALSIEFVLPDARRRKRNSWFSRRLRLTTAAEVHELEVWLLNIAQSFPNWRRNPSTSLSWWTGSLPPGTFWSLLRYAPFSICHAPVSKGGLRVLHANLILTCLSDPIQWLTSSWVDLSLFKPQERCSAHLFLTLMLIRYCSRSTLDSSLGIYPISHSFSHMSPHHAWFVIIISVCALASLVAVSDPSFSPFILQVNCLRHVSFLNLLPSHPIVHPRGKHPRLRHILFLYRPS